MVCLRPVGRLEIERKSTFSLTLFYSVQEERSANISSSTIQKLRELVMVSLSGFQVYNYRLQIQMLETCEKNNSTRQIQNIIKTTFLIFKIKIIQVELIWETAKTIMKCRKLFDIKHTFSCKTTWMSTDRFSKSRMCGCSVGISQLQFTRCVCPQ